MRRAFHRLNVSGSIVCGRQSDIGGWYSRLWNGEHVVDHTMERDQSMHLSRIEVEGFRASAETPIVCELPGRFSLLIGANGGGKTTLSEAIQLAHRHRFPQLPQIDGAALGKPPRAVNVKYAFESDTANEGALGKALLRGGYSAPEWGRPLERSLGKVRAGQTMMPTEGHDKIRLVYLPALRNPVDDLSRRDARILLELLRAEQRRHPLTGGLSDLRSVANSMLNSLTSHGLLASLEARIGTHLSAASSGVREHFAFFGHQQVDDAYLARVLELLLALQPDRLAGKRLEVSSLGFVNLLHIAVTLAGIPDPSTPPIAESGNDTVPTDSEDQASEPQLDDRAERARERLDATAELAEADADSFYPDMFHATVLIEEPEAHLHPQLQYGLLRSLKRVVDSRPDLQVIVTSHSPELIAACDPAEIVVVRRGADGGIRARGLANLPSMGGLRDKLLRDTRLHLDATRSAALFSDQVLVVEGVTEAALIRAIGRAWAGGDDSKTGFIDSLAVFPVGHKIGQWPLRLLAEPGHEIVNRVAALGDTDHRDPLTAFTPPAWQASLAQNTGRFFYSHPTLEPSLLAGNEGIIRAALVNMGATPPAVLDINWIDEFFKTKSRKKAEFALGLAALIDSDPNAFVVPGHLVELLDWLFAGDVAVPDAAVVSDADVNADAGVGSGGVPTAPPA